MHRSYLSQPLSLPCSPAPSAAPCSFSRIIISWIIFHESKKMTRLSIIKTLVLIEGQNPRLQYELFCAR
ncbi:hypothetical protein E2C01_007787 [Portunus trituberculatus]|uniref:Uncharacterized protein n=1 Tax=Portunus trituberculatus TaxID=210409 RepID=A0A5B7D115_PORTR|nr:hypothetical protein [Portunus trituberculatus]